MKKRTVIALFLLATLLISGAVFVCSCANSPPDFFAYTQKAATAELSGSLMGKPFCAKISFTPNDTGFGAKIEYLQHPAVGGLSLTAQLDSKGRATQSVQVSGKGITHKQSAASLSGLLSPLCSLLEAHEVLAVSYDKSAYTLTVGGGSLTVNQEGIPQQWHSETVDFWIVWWENEEQTIQ